MGASAESLVRLGIDLSDERRWADAAEVYLRATEKDPRWSVPWFNLGLNYKRQQLWAESLAANEKATQLDPEDEGAWWNLGIAATALQDWSTARKAWAACGVKVPDGEGPLDLNFGSVPIRLNPDDSGEVVWSRRIDPARAIILNVPYPQSGYREGDLVLHDGAPNGYRIRNGEQVPVFDVIQILQASPRSTFEAWISAENAQNVEALLDAFSDAGWAAEDWTASVQNICRQCSEGVPHEHHTRESVEWQKRRHIGLSAPGRQEALRLLDAWTNAGAARSIVEISDIVE